MATRKQTVTTLLQKALLDGGKMNIALYEYELEEHFHTWYKELIADREDYVFVVTENSGHVAMVLIAKDKTLYINEEAREKLSMLWKLNYKNNMRILIPKIVDDLSKGFLSVNGVVVVDNSKGRRLGSKGFGN